MKLKRICPHCNKIKYFWEMSHGELCKECNSKEWDKYYEKMSKEELLIELKSYRKTSKNELPYGFIFFIGFLITFVYCEFIDKPHIFSTYFLGNCQIVINQLFTACGYVFLSCIASAIFLIGYIAATHKFESRIAKVIATIILIITIFLFYVSYLTE